MQKQAQKQRLMLSSSLKIFAIFALVGAFVAPAFAYTSPGNASGYVNDFAGVLSPQAKTELEATLTQFHTDTNGDIAVAIVPSLSGDDIESYANTLFREWGVGKKDDDTGILMVVAIEDRKIRIEVGYGYEGVVPDAYASRIVNEVITPKFKEGDYDGGIKNGVGALVTLIKDPNAELPPAGSTSGFSFKDFEFFAYVFFFGITWVGSILARSKSWWGGGIVGGVVAIILYFIFGLTVALFSALPLIGFGLLFDYIVSNAYANAKSNGRIPPWWIGGGGFGGGRGGGFGGFGGGSSGGGGASGSW